jgi:pimeloyl-ACP methyl ester carboxylesterase
VEIIDRGNGVPLVLVPGLQGRWEYLSPAVDALAESFRVLTFALRGERASGLRFDASAGLDNYADQICRVLDDRGVAGAAICGVSFGGLAALRFAAAHPDRTTALILASTPGPLWHLRRSHQLYARAPWIFGPLFFLETPHRLRKELAVARPDLRERWRFARWQMRTLVAAPLSVTRMAERARLISVLNRVADCRRVEAPTLIVTGERGLDYVVPVEGSSQYLQYIRDVRAVVLEGTGHLGSITKPHEFARIVDGFVSAVDHSPAEPERES